MASVVFCGVIATALALAADRSAAAPTESRQGTDQGVPEAERERLIAQGDSLNMILGELHEAGRDREAIHAARSVLELRRKAFGETHPAVASALRNLGALHTDLGQISTADSLYRAALEVHHAAGEADSVPLYSTMRGFAVVLSYERDYDRAISVSKAALELARRTPALTKFIPEQYLDLANICSQAGELDSAMVFYKHADVLASRTDRDPNLSLNIRIGIATVMHQQGRTAAEDSTLASVLMDADTQGVKIRTKLSVLATVGDAWLSGGNARAADSVFAVATDLARDSTGAGAATLSALLLRRGDAQQALFRGERADSFYQAAYDLVASEGTRRITVLGLMGRRAARARERGDLSVADSLLRIQVREWQAIAPDHPSAALAEHNLGIVLFEEGRYRQADSILVVAEQKEGRSLGPTNPDYLRGLSNLANVYSEYGLYSRSDSLAMHVLEHANVEHHSGQVDRVRVLSTLGVNARATGRLERAESLYVLALEASRNMPGRDGAMLQITVRQNLASLLMLRGHRSAAEQQYRLALGLLGPTMKVPALAAVLTDNLARVLSAAGRATEAESYYRESIRLRRAVFGDSHPETIKALNSLAMHQLRSRSRGDRQAALATMRLILSVSTASHANAFGRAVVLSNCGAIADECGRKGLADSLYAAASQLYPPVSRGGLQSAQLQYDIGFHLVSRRRPREAAAYVAGAVECFETAAATLIAGSPDAEARFLLEESDIYDDLLIGLALREAREDRTIITAAVRQIVARRGLIFRATAWNGGGQRAPQCEPCRNLVDSLAETRRMLMRVAVPAAREREPRSGMDERELVARVESLVDRLGALGYGQVGAVPAQSLEAVRRKLDDSTALVYYARHRIPGSERGGREPRYRYAAALVRRSAELKLYDLGPAPECENEMRAAVARMQTPSIDPRRSCEALGRRLLGQIVRDLAGVTRLAISADALVNLVPFGALIVNGKPLIEQYTVVFTQQGAIVDAARPAGRSRPVILADPDFDDCASVGVDGDGIQPERVPGPLGVGNLKRLDGTRKEARAVWDALRHEAEVCTAKCATKARLLVLAGPRFLHVSTHGGGTVLRIGTDRSAAPRWSSAFLEGGALALAGANCSGAASADGILTGLEASGLDLRGTSVVVLSACESGRGAPGDSEGLYGLQRGFLVAGARFVVSSLWRVDDEVTAALMSSFYGAMAVGQTPPEALRAAMVATARSSGSHPYYWAPFVICSSGGEMN